MRLCGPSDAHVLVTSMGTERRYASVQTEHLQLVLRAQINEELAKSNFDFFS